MSDRIAVMDRGKVLQVGKPEEIYETPTTRFVADFIGETNFLTGRITTIEENCAIVELDANTRIRAGMNEPTLTGSQEVTVAIRPEKINLFAVEGLVRYPDGTSDQATQYKLALQRDPDINIVEGTITYANYIGTDTRYIVTFGEGHQMIVRIQNFGLRSDTVFQIGQRVNIFWDADHSRVLLE
jgi:spermidine/putrescine transport system ATP-binding protein